MLLSGHAFLAAQTATKLWEFVTGGPIQSSPALGSDGTVYFGSGDGRVYALAPGGAKRWEFVTGSGVAASPAITAEDTVVVGSYDTKVYALSPAGAKRWEFRTGGAVRSSAAVGVDGTLYVGSLDGRLYALTPAGALRWSYRTGGEIHSSPAVGVDGTVYVGSRDAKLVALNPDGTRRWEFATGGGVDSSPALGADGTICFGSIDGRILGLAPDGTKRWEVGTGDGVYASPTVGPDGAVYVPGYSGWLYALNAEGTVRWATALGTRAAYSSAALAQDGTVFFGAMDGKVYAYRADGTKRWEFATGAEIGHASPVLADDGTVYLGSGDGKLYAFKHGSGPAVGPWPMFRRDAAHTASGCVERELPGGYGAGATIVVRLRATPPPGTSSYVVEDTPPANWSVGTMSDHGTYDATSRRVKFGPFTDGLARELAYTVSAPLNETGARVFAGVSVVDGSKRLLGGVQGVEAVPLHPADLAHVDGWLTVGEVTAYGAAYKRGTSWPAGPNPVPAAYLTRAFQLWQQGEVYRYQTGAVTAPLWWTGGATNAWVLGPDLVSVPAGVGPTNGQAVADLPVNFEPGTPLRVDVRVTPATNVTVYAVEDTPPAGWSVTGVSEQGLWDPLRAKVKWGPFFDAGPRVLSYTVTPPADAAGTNVFRGLIACDAALGEVVGQRVCLRAGSPISASFVLRRLPASYSPGTPLSVALETQPPADTAFHVVEDTPPAGWAVSEVSDHGYFDSGNRTVRFGPFFDARPRRLTYRVTPPLTESDTERFTGTAAVSGLSFAIGGDGSIPLVPLHPADHGPADSWLTLPELVAYGAAWKRGATWPFPPSPIAPDYLAKAVELWRAGEWYAFDTHAAVLPSGWSVLTNGLPAGASPPLSPALGGTNGTAVVTVPETYEAGRPLAVRVEVVPGAGVLAYGVEDTPPAGWLVTQVGADGVYDARRHKVKWGPFFDPQPRVLTYEVQGSAGATNAASFQGMAAFDGSAMPLLGRRQTFPANAPPVPILTLVGRPTSAGLGLSVQGAVAERYALEASTDLVDWTAWVSATLTNPAGTMTFLDGAATNLPARFYRARWVVP